MPDGARGGQFTAIRGVHSKYKYVQVIIGQSRNYSDSTSYSRPDTKMYQSRREDL